MEIEDTNKGRRCDPSGACKGLGIHYHCVKCWEPTSMLGHLIPESKFNDPKFTCEEDSNA